MGGRDDGIRRGAEGEEAAGEGGEPVFEAYQKAKAGSGFRTIREIAKAAGISPTTIQAIEKQHVKPQYKTIKALAKAFKVTPGALCT